MQPAEITYGQSFDEIVGMYSTNASFEFANNEDKKVKPVPGVYYIYFNIYLYLPYLHLYQNSVYNTHTTISKITNMDLWCSTGNSTQYSMITYMGQGGV